MPGKTNLLQKKSTGVDQITKDDLAIFRLGASNANYFTDHYVRTPSSGTYWKNNPTDAYGQVDVERQQAWEIMYADWIKSGKPDKAFNWPLGGTFKFAVQWDEQHNPVFWHSHGWLWQPWQLLAHHATQPDMTIIGGFGSGKTALIAMSLVVLAATIPQFRGFAVAPQMLQAMEVYNYIKANVSDTPYWSRWVVGNPTRPFPKYVIRNSLVGESTIEILSIEDDPEKVRTLEGDILYLDQAEKFDDLDTIQRDAGTRTRGQVRGRSRLGKMIWIANAGDNPQLWYRYDMGTYEPQFYLSLNPKSTDNPYLSKQDIANFKRRISSTASPEEIEQWMDGKRPMGSGEHFSRAMVRACTNDSINKMLEEMMALPEEHPRRQGFVYRKSDILGLYHYEIPPDHSLKRDYIVISDPGSGNPPARNSAVVGVFDVSEFPERPMKMVAFHWIGGDQSYWPWILEHQRFVELYRAHGRNAFDSTGTQKGFDELVFSELGLAAEGMNMAVSGKMLALNALKFFMGKGLLEFPYVAHLSNQLTNYRLPDNKIPQDLVSMLAMAAAWARRLYYVELDNESEEDRRKRIGNLEVERYTRSPADRYTRSIAPRLG